ncbi:MAG: hypothetical protein AAGG06_02955 [Pseudomonadota bacterium]
MTEKDPFFVGYLPVPPGLRRFLPAVALLLVAGFIGLGYAVSATQDDPGDGRFRWDVGRQEVVGVLTASPYPVLRVTQATERYREGQVLMLSGQGKRGVVTEAAALDGQAVRVVGIGLTRGDLEMIQVSGRNGLLAEDAGPAAPITPEDLGRWRLTGEICDGKCYAGAMRPGTGLAHKACANLCLIGGVPPVFVATGPVEGRQFFLMAGQDGGPLSDGSLDYVGALVEAEGQVLRLGDLMVFQMDPATLGPPR